MSVEHCFVEGVIAVVDMFRNFLWRPYCANNVPNVCDKFVTKVHYDIEIPELWEKVEDVRVVKSLRIFRLVQINLNASHVSQ